MVKRKLAVITDKNGSKKGVKKVKLSEDNSTTNTSNTPTNPPKSVNSVLESSSSSSSDSGSETTFSGENVGIGDSDFPCCSDDCMYCLADNKNYETLFTIIRRRMSNDNNSIVVKLCSYSENDGLFLVHSYNHPSVNPDKKYVWVVDECYIGNFINFDKNVYISDEDIDKNIPIYLSNGWTNCTTL